MNTLVHEQVYRGEALLEKMAAQPFVICGAGAVGSNLVNNMTRQGFQKLTVIDMDRVEDHNRHTQVWTRRDQGQLKAAMLKNHVFMNMGISIEAVSRKLEESNVKKMLPKGSIVVDGFDNMESRKVVTDHCKSNGIECLHVGLAADYAEVIWNERYHVPKNVVAQDVCEYPLARNVIVIAAAVATECLIRYLSTGEKRNYMITLGDLKIEELV